MIVSQFSPETTFPAGAAPLIRKAFVIMGLLIACIVAAQANPAIEGPPGDSQARVIDGVSNSTVFGLGQSIRITGTVKEGAIAFGGDVIVEGAVDGDVAAIGGSVIQREGARIGGDVIVLGGIYHHGKAAPDRDPKSVTIMYAGYEDQLRRVMRGPFSGLQPQLSAVFLGTRLLAILIWFVVALALTGVMPNTISRAGTRLQMTRLPVAVSGLNRAISGRLEEDGAQQCLTRRAHSFIKVELSQSTDDVLVGAAAAGDEGAFEQLFERHRRQVARVASRFFAQREQIEEIIQDSFTKAYFALGSYHGTHAASFRAWLSQIAINCCYDQLRRARRRPE